MKKQKPSGKLNKANKMINDDKVIENEEAMGTGSEVITDSYSIYN